MAVSRKATKRSASITPSCTRNRQVSTWQARKPAIAADMASTSSFLSTIVLRCVRRIRSAARFGPLVLGLPKKSEQLQAWGQRQAARKRLHFFLHHGLGLAPGIRVGGEQQVLDDLLF